MDKNIELYLCFLENTSTEFMKYYKITGLLACTLLALSCFLPWAYYADIDKTFTGFFSQQNSYGKPGKAFIFIAVFSAILILVNRIWAKRLLLFLNAINIAYLIKTYVLFTTCYATVCPQKEYGLYLLMIASVVLMIVSVFPDMKLAETKEVKE